MSLRASIETIIKYTISVLLILLVILASWQVVTRYIFDSPSQYTDESLRFIMIWMGYLAAPYAFGITDKHMSFNMIKNKFTNRARVGIEIFNSTIVLLFLGMVLIYGGVKFTQMGIGSYSDSLQLPLWLVYSIMPLSGILALYFKVENTIEVIKDVTKES